MFGQPHPIPNHHPADPPERPWGDSKCEIDCLHIGDRRDSRRSAKPILFCGPEGNLNLFSSPFLSLSDTSKRFPDFIIRLGGDSMGLYGFRIPKHHLSPNHSRPFCPSLHCLPSVSQQMSGSQILHHVHSLLRRPQTTVFRAPFQHSSSWRRRRCWHPTLPSASRRSFVSQSTVRLLGLPLGSVASQMHLGWIIWSLCVAVGVAG